jgi:hypothetical protein
VTLRTSHEICLCAPHSALLLDSEEYVDELAYAAANEPKEYMYLPFEARWLIMLAFAVDVVEYLKNLFQCFDSLGSIVSDLISVVALRLCTLLWRRGSRVLIKVLVPTAIDLKHLEEEDEVLEARRMGPVDHVSQGNRSCC